MSRSPIVAAVRRVRERHAAKFKYDLDAIRRDQSFSSERPMALSVEPRKGA